MSQGDGQGRVRRCTIHLALGVWVCIWECLVYALSYLNSNYLIKSVLKFLFLFYRKLLEFGLLDLPILLCILVMWYVVTVIFQSPLSLSLAFVCMYVYIYMYIHIHIHIRYTYFLFHILWR